MSSKDSLQLLYCQHPRVLTIFAASVFFLPIPWFIRNYNAYIDLEPGGLPHNVWGWMFATLLKPLSRETVSITEYDLDPNKDSWLKQYGTLPKRERKRPTTSWHSIPHRQLDQYANEYAAKRLKDTFMQIAVNNTDIVQTQLSPHEKRCDAMMIHPSIKDPHPVATKALREIGHIHYRKDNSLHVVLAPQDCKIVIEQGWGERHPLSGVIALPKEYIMIYAPSTKEEVLIIGNILRAAVGFMTGSNDVQ